MVGTPELEFQNRASQEAQQSKRLLETLAYLQTHAPFYKRILPVNQVKKIRSIADLPLLPTTTKEDLQLYNRDFFCVPDYEFRDVNTTSGTLGKPVLVPLTEKDLQRLTYNEWLSMQYMNVGTGNKVQLLLTLDRQFMAGMAYYQGARKAGATVLRTGPGLPALQWDMIFKLGIDTLVAVPSFLLKLIQHAKQNGIDYQQSAVKRVLAIGESIRTEQLEANTLLATLQADWPIQFHSTYAATEMQTAFTECVHGRGGHLHPELVIVEILDDAGAPVAAGETGEVSITTLGVEAMPLLRYRTGDIAQLHLEPCACGRQTPRLGPILGRKQQMIKFKGTTIYPPALFDLLQQRPEIQEYYIALTTTTTGQDDLKIYLLAEGDTAYCKEQLMPLLKHKLRAVPEVLFVNQTTMQQLQFPIQSRKPIRFKDYRNTENDIAINILS